MREQSLISSFAGSPVGGITTTDTVHIAAHAAVVEGIGNVHQAVLCIERI
jgi:hypothetical protein